jgi:arylsulfatase A-like enzyme
MNAPLRGHKGTPFEAGVRVPAFVVDFTPDQRYLSQPAETARAPTKPVTAEHSRVYRGLMHISDWLPTLLSFAGVPAAELPAGIDGKDFSAALRSAVYEDADSAEDVCQGTFLLVLLLHGTDWYPLQPQSSWIRVSCLNRSMLLSV